MATPEEIERRIEEKDAPRTARRSAVAKQVSELAQRRAAIVEQLGDIERELGDVLVDVQDVIEVDELARFTDVPAADLTQWLTARTAKKTVRAKHKRPSTNSSAHSDKSGGRSAARTPTASKSSTPPQPAVPRADTVDTPSRVAAVT
jgi:hypothetical protein